MSAETKTETELVIDSPSQKLILDVLSLVPAPPKFSKFTFVADGIVQLRGPREEREKIEQDYIAECLAAKVIPYSHLRMDFKGEMFTFGAEGFVDRGGYFNDSTFQLHVGSPEKYSPTMEAIIKGGRLHRISFQSGTEDGEEPFRHVMDRHLPLLIASGYILRAGEWWLTERYSRGGDYGESGYDPVSSFHLEDGYPYWGALVMKTRGGWELNSDLEAYKRQDEFRTWFKGMALKHGTEVTVPAESLLR